jgi:hypothetical protein
LKMNVPGWYWLRGGGMVEVRGSGEDCQALPGRYPGDESGSKTTSSDIMITSDQVASALILGAAAIQAINHNHLLKRRSIEIHAKRS